MITEIFEPAFPFATHIPVSEVINEEAVLRDDRVLFERVREVWQHTYQGYFCIFVTSDKEFEDEVGVSDAFVEEEIPIIHTQNGSGFGLRTRRRFAHEACERIRKVLQSTKIE